MIYPLTSFTVYSTRTLFTTVTASNSLSPFLKRSQRTTRTILTYFADLLTISKNNNNNKTTHTQIHKRRRRTKVMNYFFMPQPLIKGRNHF